MPRSVRRLTGVGIIDALLSGSEKKNCQVVHMSCTCSCRQTVRVVASGRTRAESVDTLGSVLPADVLQAARETVLSYGPESHVCTMADGKQFFVKKANSAERAKDELEINQQLPTTRVFAPRMYGMF